MTARVVLPAGGWEDLASRRPAVLPAVWGALGLGAGGHVGARGDLQERPVDDLVDPLVDAALGEMDAVLRSTGPARDTAFRLLAADALLTWACEAAADAADPGDRLAQVVDRVAAGAS